MDNDNCECGKIGIKCVKYKGYTICEECVRKIKKIKKNIIRMDNENDIVINHLRDGYCIDRLLYNYSPNRVTIFHRYRISIVQLDKQLPLIARYNTRWQNKNIYTLPIISIKDCPRKHCIYCRGKSVTLLCDKCFAYTTCIVVGYNIHKLWLLSNIISHYDIKSVIVTTFLQCRKKK